MKASSHTTIRQQQENAAIEQLLRNQPGLASALVRTLSLDSLHQTASPPFTGVRR